VDSFPLTKYLVDHSRQLINQLIRHHLRDPKTAIFLLKRAHILHKAGKIRLASQKKGVQIPAFLIASIANRCNLNCLGCYARATGICDEDKSRRILAKDEWENIFHQAGALGISFCLLAGGEPLLRPDVLEAACQAKELVYPIFTNGTLFTKKAISLLQKNPHLIPIISMEGAPESTDERRGIGMGIIINEAMKSLKKAGIMMGVSITVTTKNMDHVLTDDFMDYLDKSGVQLVFLIEYVPMEQADHPLAFTPESRVQLLSKSQQLKHNHPRIALLSFPGDEVHLGGCLAAGRGFFHINPYGDAEACPFAPYSDRNLRNHSLYEVLSSPFFQALREEGLVGGEHDGGCSLFEHDQEVKAILASIQSSSK
jgi:MoaA/NifB/PqqE/SkfB family radical SAM enzyme